MSERPDVMICMRCVDFPEHLARRVGCVERSPCGTCSADCWRSPSTPKDVPIVCSHCVDPSLAANLLPSSAESLAEIDAFFGKERPS